jgi:hypothetical protein
MRFGPSEGYSKRYGVESRNAFLGAIERVAADVLLTLYSDVYPQFRKAMSLLPSSPAAIAAMRAKQQQGFAPADFSLEEETRALDAALLAWSKRFHLESRWEHNWILQAALDTMNDWQRQDAAPPLQWHRYKVPREDVAERGEPFHFEAAGWDPRRETPRQARRRMRELFKLQLHEYMEKSKSQLRHWRDKRKLALTNPLYFEWLVSYLVLGRELEEMALDHSQRIGPLEAAQILQAIHPLSVVLGLKWATLGTRRSGVGATRFN